MRSEMLNRRSEKWNKNVQNSSQLTLNKLVSCHAVNKLHGCFILRDVYSSEWCDNEENYKNSFNFHLYLSFSVVCELWDLSTLSFFACRFGSVYLVCWISTPFLLKTYFQISSFFKYLWCTRKFFLVQNWQLKRSKIETFKLKRWIKPSHYYVDCLSGLDGTTPVTPRGWRKVDFVEK